MVLQAVMCVAHRVAPALRHVGTRSLSATATRFEKDPKFTAKFDREMTAAEIWTNKQKGAKLHPQPFEKDSPFYRPDNTLHLRRPPLGVGPLHPPLHMPEYDQSLRSAQESGLPSPPAYWEFEFDDPATKDFTRDYPKLRTQYTDLRDPYKYWDSQGRRNYGEIVQEHDLMLDKWSPGPSTNPYKPAALLAAALTCVYGLYQFSVYVTSKNPVRTYASNVMDYPFDNLATETAGSSDVIVPLEVTNLRRKLADAE